MGVLSLNDLAVDGTLNTTNQPTNLINRINVKNMAWKLVIKIEFMTNLE